MSKSNIKKIINNKSIDNSDNDINDIDSDDNYSEENYSEDNSYETKLDNLNQTISNRISNLEKKFNKIKNNFFKLTKLYESLRYKNTNNNMNDTEISENNKNLFEDKLNEIFLNERKENINLVNNSFSKYFDENKYKFSTDDIVTNDSINVFQSECEQNLNELSVKYQTTHASQKNNFSLILKEANREYGTIYSLLDENELNLLNSYSDKATAIRDMLKIFNEKFSVEKDEVNNFEEKISKLIEDLCNKIVLKKKK